MPCIKLQNAEIGEIIDEIKQVESQPMTKIDPIKSGFSIAGSIPYYISVIIVPVGKWTSNFPIKSNTFETSFFQNHNNYHPERQIMWRILSWIFNLKLLPKVLYHSDQQCCWNRSLLVNRFTWGRIFSSVDKFGTFAELFKLNLKLTLSLVKVMPTCPNYGWSHRLLLTRTESQLCHW